MGGQGLCNIITVDGNKNFNNNSGCKTLSYYLLMFYSLNYDY